MAAHIYRNNILFMTVACQSTVCCTNHMTDPDAFLELLASMEACGFHIELI
tara:strand:- start:281 stop:433 length:153 start_codon:yes stop_codon:yes gene_type:complete